MADQNRLSIVPCADYEPDHVRAALSEALSRVGGLDWVKPGMRIGVKLNLCAAKKPEAAIGINLADDLLRALVERGDLAETQELERKPDGTAKPKYHGLTFISTPERIAAYRESFGA